MAVKLRVVDYLRPLLSGRGGGVFNNLDDEVTALRAGLEAGLGRVAVETQGCLALFEASWQRPARKTASTASG
jgi:hypothetical protein